MDAELQSHVAFHLTGKRHASGLEAVDPAALRPALLARYRDLSSLRYDYPLVFAESAGADESVQALSAVIDAILQQVARGEDGERVTRHVLRLERQLRAAAAGGTRGSLSTIWDATAERLGVRADALLRDSIARARAALKVDGALVDCDAMLPERRLEHVWGAVQQAKARAFRDNVHRLIQKLSDILGADLARSAEGRSA